MKGLRLKNIILRLFVTVMVWCGTSPCVWGRTTLHPLVLIPGAGGNQLEARLTQEYQPTSLLCNRWYPLGKDHEGWYRIWFDPSVLLAPFTQCFAQRMMLRFDPHVHDYCNAEGVETRVPRFGSTHSLLYLDPYLKSVFFFLSICLWLYSIDFTVPLAWGR